MLDTELGADCAVVRLSRNDGTGLPLSLIAPFDLLHPIERCDRPRRAHRREVAAACAAALADAHSWTGLRTALDANIRILDFQLEPALALLRGDCTRLLLADEVGLGKTIQAGLIISELRARHEAERVLIVTPAGLRNQWQRELGARCALTVRRVDAASLAFEGRALPPWIDYWSLPGISLVSIDLVKRAEILAQLAHTIWDVVVLDEAHHAAQHSERGEAAAALCARARYVILMTATPHGGDQDAFERLLRLGELAGDSTPIRTFRRTRADAGLHGPSRKSRSLRVRLADDEARMHEVLDRYTQRVWRETHAASHARLAMIVLRKRALSSPAALARSVERRLAALDPSASSDIQLSFRFDDMDGEAIADDEAPEVGLSEPGLRDAVAERRLLEDVLDAARNAEPRHAKLSALARALGRTREPAIVFTEYRDTLRHLETRLRGEAPIVCLHGGLLPAAREAAIDAFVHGRARVLLATDAAAEGLNLHHRCRWVIHFEVPWSTVRLEQRTGRVDRIGQSRQVHAWSFVSAGTDEERVLTRLDARQALSEEEVARIVFGERETIRQSGRTGESVGKAASREARRLVAIARLCATPVSAPARPVRAAVRRRGAFRSFKAGEVVLFHALLTDGSGQRIAAECAALAGPRGHRSVRRRAVRLLGRQLGRSVADRRRFARVAISRAAALEAYLKAEASGSFQQSLFDRRAEQAADIDRTGLGRGVAHLRAVARRANGALARPAARVTTIATFEIR